MASASAEEKARKVKSLLSSYYTVDRNDASLESTTAGGPGYASRLEPGARGPSPSGAAAAQGSSGSAGGWPPAYAAPASSYSDPETYLYRLLRDTGLADLAARHREVLAEVGSLDSDMQMLVYENYNKFITATDTIRLMSGSMEGMDTEMAALEGLIEGVVHRSEAINSKLEARQRTIEELNAVRQLLRKLQGVFDLPKRLRAMLEAGALDLGAESYAEVGPFLRRHGHKGAFKKVSQEVEACRKDLAAALRRQLSARPEEAAECIQLIAKLGEPTESLQDMFLACKRQRMEATLAAAGLVLRSVAVERGLLDPAELGEVEEPLRQSAEAWFPHGPGDPAPSLDAVAVALDTRFLTELTHTAASFSELFEADGRPRLVKMAREVFQRYLKLARRALLDAAASAGAAAAGIDASGEPLSRLQDLLARAQSEDESREAAPGGHAGVGATLSSDWGARELLQGLYVMRTDLSRLHSILPELSPKDRASELVEHAVRQYVGLCFAALEQRVMATAAGIRSALGAQPQAKLDLQQGLLVLQALLLQGTERLLLSLKEFERQKWVLQSWRDVFVSVVHGQLQNFLLSSLRQLLEAGGAGVGGGEEGAKQSGLLPNTSSLDIVPPYAAPHRTVFKAPGAAPATDAPAALSLLLAGLCSFTAQEVLPQLLGQLQQLYPEPGDADSGDPPGFVAADVGRQAVAASTALLRSYVDRRGQAIKGSMLQSERGWDWAGLREVTAPRPLCDVLISALSDVEAEVTSVSLAARQIERAPSAGQLHSLAGGGSHSRHASNASNEAIFGGPMQRTFAPDGGAALELTPHSVATAVLCAALRTLVEALQGQTLNRIGFQQVQLDVHYLRSRLQQAAVGGAHGPSAMQLLDEVMASAMERCGEPLMLDTVVLDRLLTSSRKIGQAAGRA